MKKELIKISEFQRRRWGENGTPQCPQAIRNHSQMFSWARKRQPWRALLVEGDP